VAKKGNFTHERMIKHMIGEYIYRLKVAQLKKLPKLILAPQEITR